MQIFINQEHFLKHIRNTLVVEYARLVDFIKDQPLTNYTGTCAAFLDRRNKYFI